LALAWLLVTAPTRAAFHLMMVVEVFPGYTSNPNAQYIELQMYFPGQNFVSTQSILVYDAAGALIGTFTFPVDLPNGADQASILIATTQAQTLFGVTADLVMTPLISPSGGKVCFDGSGDCVAWGNYSGSATGVGSPFSPGGLPLGQAAQRRLDRGTPGVLDLSDDTDDSATDFVSAAPTPRNNANALGAVAGYASTPAPPGPIAFGSIVVGFTLSANLQVQEAGAATLTVSNPVFAGANPGDFSTSTTFPLTITDGAPPQTLQLGCTPQAQGARTATLTLTTNDPARPTVAYDLTCTGLPTPPALSFFTVTPCRVVDTRLVGGPVAAGADRTIPIVGGACAVPITAKAVSLNIAVTQPSGPGNVRLFPAGAAVPTASTINYAAGQTRTNNVVVGLSVAGELTARVQPSGSTHVILDVNGYFE
jgi:hypothetical protein